MSPGLPRVLVLTGTTEHGFERLLAVLPGLVASGEAAEVRVQGRHRPPAAPGLVALGMIARDAVAREVAEADVVVTHGGSGSCIEVLRAGHRPIVVARRADLGEHVDDHQKDLTAELGRLGLAAVATDPLAASLPALVRAAAGAGRAPPPRMRPLGAALRVLADGLRRGAAGPARVRVERASSARHAAAFREAARRHPLQSPAWGEARAFDGWRRETFVALGRDSRPAACAQVLRRASPVLPAYLPQGPVLLDAPDALEGARRLLAHAAGTSPTGLVWAPPADERISPLLDGPRVRVLEGPSTTGIVALDDDAAMLARMRPTWRRSLQHALADPGLSVSWEDPANHVEGLLARVHALAASRGFKPPVSLLVGRWFAASTTRCGLHPLACSTVRGDVVLDRWFGVVGGTWSLTLWNVHEDVEGESHGGRLALWALLRRARELGATAYDLAGIDDAGNPGGATFKRGAGAHVVEVPGLRWVAPARLPASAVSPLATAIRRARPGAGA